MNLAWIEPGVQGDSHLSTRREDVDRPVVVEIYERAVDRGRLGQLLDLLAQRGDLVTRLLDRDGQFLVARARLGELSTSLEELLLEHFDATVGLINVTQREIAGRVDHYLVVIVRGLTESLVTVHTFTLGEVRGGTAIPMLISAAKVAVREQPRRAQ